MVGRVNIKAFVGKQRAGSQTDELEANYIADMRAQFNGILNNLNEFINQIEALTPEALIEVLEPTFELSQEYCPVKTGDLKESGFLEVSSTGKKPSVVMGYGKGGYPAYAIYVHEMVYYRHEEPTSAKFLLRAIEEDSSNIQNRIVEKFGDMVVG